MNKREEISVRLQAARAILTPITGRHPVPAHKTYSLCQHCYRKVYSMSGMKLDLDGTKHQCTEPPHDTERPPPFQGESDE